MIYYYIMRYIRLLKKKKKYSIGTWTCLWFFVFFKFWSMPTYIHLYYIGYSVKIYKLKLSKS